MASRPTQPLRRTGTRRRSTSPAATRPRTDRVRLNYLRQGGLRVALFAGRPNRRRPARATAVAAAAGRRICCGPPPPWYRPPIDSGRSMAETADDLSAPLGQQTVRPKRRFRLPFTPIQALEVLLGLI